MKKFILCLVFIPLSILISWIVYGYGYEGYNFNEWDAWYKLCFIFTTAISSIAIALTIKDYEK